MAEIRKRNVGKSTPGDEEVSEDKIWHKQQEAILKRWSEIGSSYRYMHDRAFSKYSKQNFRFALPVIIISTITGTANFAQGSFPSSWQSYVPLGIGFLNLSAGLITTIAQFLRVSELLEGHRAAAIAYSKFSRNISVELSLPREDRSTGGTEFVNSSRNELDRLIEQSPNIPIEIIKEFGEKFKDTSFMKPEILNITDVEVYVDDKKEKAKRKLQEIRQAEAIRSELLQTEMVRRKSILHEIMAEQKMQEEQIKRDIKTKKQAKKDNVSVASVQNKMKKLISKLQNNDANNDIVTPSSSDTSDEGNNIGLNINELHTGIDLSSDDGENTVVDINMGDGGDGGNEGEGGDGDDGEGGNGAGDRPSTPQLLIDPSGNNL